MEHWNEPMLEPWEREAAISTILNRALVQKPGLGRLLRSALNTQVLFWGVVDCIFLSTLAAVVLMIPLLTAVLKQVSPAPMLFLASPALYALLLGLTFWKESQSGLLEWKQSCCLSLQTVSALRMVTREEILAMDGFGEKSYQNLMESIDRARTTTLARVIYGLGILNIGLANAKMICREYEDDLERMMQADVEELSLIPGVGAVIAGTFHAYWQSEKNREDMELLMQELVIERTEADPSSQVLKGLVFVVTGSLTHFENRSALKEAIEEKGGKVTGSVTGKTTCLINNDNTSNSAKNKKARELNVPVITEEEFMRKYLDWEE